MTSRVWPEAHLRVAPVAPSALLGRGLCQLLLPTRHLLKV